MKIYIWLENSESDFVEEINSEFDNKDFGAHSAGIIVLAESKEEAIKMAEKQHEKKLINKPQVIELNKKGVVLYADGEC